jgi:hypothetical protein
MAKICLLKAEILRMHLVFTDITTVAMTAIRMDLQHWYQQLPEEMRLDATGQDDISLESRRTVLHVHLLYLGTVMLLYRRIAAQVLQQYTTGCIMGRLQTSLPKTVIELSEESALAARTSARIVKLLHEDDGVFKRCWLVM